MLKRKKNFLGLLGLVLVALMTVVAYFLPAEGAFAEGTSSVTDTIRVTVYDQFPSVEITSPETDYVAISKEITVTVLYENVSYVNFTLKYNDEDGNPQTVTLPQFIPDDLDPVYNYASGTKTITINLDDYGLSYGHYTFSVDADSPVGKPAGGAIEFDYVPAMLEQTGSEENTNDPIVDVEWSDGIAKIEIMPVDGDGNPLFDEPIVIEVPAPYEAGSQSVTLPFTSYGIESGDYDIVITTYRAETDPGTGETTFVVVPSPHASFPISYTRPNAPDVPNTGSFLGGFSLAKGDIVITSVIAFVFIALIAFIFVGRRKKDYRKNVRSRK